MTDTAISADILVYAAGYESRSRYVAEKIKATKKIAIILPRVNANIGVYQENVEYAHMVSDAIIDHQDLTAEKIQSELSARLQEIKTDNLDVPLTIALDVSSLPRETMAQLIIGLDCFSAYKAFTLRLIYTFGEYKSPEGQDGIYTNFKPITKLEGWTLYPERPLSVILGLGYEPDQAVGVIEYFDPSGKWAFIPNGIDLRFRKDIQESNASLWPMLEKRNKLEYFIGEPNRLYYELRGLVDVLCKQSRVIIVSGGPKIFSAISILVCLEFKTEVSLWRASAHEHGVLSDTMPADNITVFDYHMPRSMEHEGS